MKYNEIWLDCHGELILVEIQNGCTRVHGQANTWLYSNMLVGEDRRDDVIFENIIFTSLPDERPVIGDFISAGKLVKRTEPKVNPDWSKWKDKDLYGNL